MAPVGEGDQAKVIMGVRRWSCQEWRRCAKAIKG